MSILEYVVGKLDRDQFDKPYTAIGCNKAKYYIAECLDNLTGSSNHSGSFVSYNEYNGLVEDLYELLFETESISICGCDNDLDIPDARVYPRQNPNMDKVNERLQELLKESE